MKLPFKQRKANSLMNLKTTIALILALITSCQMESGKKQPASNKIVFGLISNFESELNKLNNNEITSIDQATNLFQKYALKTDNINQKDSLFQPYFDFYNNGRELLKNQPEEKALEYGFKKHKVGETEYLLPILNEYFESNIINHLTKPMQDFCRQQLKEFTDSQNLETIANNTLWWERFNTENEDFFLNEMTKYHYKNWHLKNLISGTEKVNVFTKEDKLSDQAYETYQKILEYNTDTKTADVLQEYMILLEKANMEKTTEVLEFINRYK